MKDYYSNLRQIIDEYNSISDKVKTGIEELTNEEDEFMDNFSVYLAHALIKDTGSGQLAREELCKVADIINIICV